MRNLADKAYELSRKHDLKDEVELIQEEERKLSQYLFQNNNQPKMTTPQRFASPEPPLRINHQAAS